MKEELINITLSSFEYNFGTKEDVTTVAVPASIILLGDHTHYNDGVILSVAIDRYAVAVVKKRDDDNLNIVFSDCELSYFTSVDKCSSEDIQCGQVSFGPLLGILREEKIITHGFNCMINSNIPSALGLGGVTAHHIALLVALNKALELNLSGEDIISLSRRGEMESIGKISNRAHHRTVLEAKTNSLFYTDLRKDTVNFMNLKKAKYKIIICDTGKIIENIKDICNERIAECKVGVDGLRLYIWGIKNLRDVNIDFLQKHVHMIPHRIYSRVYYNVSERMRVESLISDLNAGKIGGLTKAAHDSHYSLRKDYEIGSEKLDYLVSKFAANNSVIASKMISCSAMESIYAFVKADDAESVINNIKEEYYNKFGEKLTTYTLDIVKGCESV